MTRIDRPMFLCATLAILAACTAPPKRDIAPNAYYTIALYSNYGGSPSGHGTQGATCTINLNTQPFFQTFRFQDHDGGCKNDDAKSIDMRYVPAGTTIELFDDPKCGTTDDWVQIKVLKQIPHAWTHGFDYDDDDSDGGDGDIVYQMRFHNRIGYGGDGQVEGKVSCMIIDVPGVRRQ
ncbi:hypothetical protein [Luteibacter sp. CQ10]|uniref:hypothetical protein n=1 Tax=Luteibacter sp. CQ10 TaxID=2805821 RepID=UPI0034A31B61